MSSVATIIFSKDRKSILLTKRRDVPVWVLPGGAIDSGETPEEAAIRETLEETGLKTSIRRKIAEYIPTNRLTKYTYFFECTMQSGELALCDETTDIRFFSITNLPKRLPPPHPEWIDDACKARATPLCKPIYSVNYWSFIKNCILHPILMARFIISKI